MKTLFWYFKIIIVWGIIVFLVIEALKVILDGAILVI